MHLTYSVFADFFFFSSAFRDCPCNTYALNWQRPPSRYTYRWKEAIITTTNTEYIGEKHKLNL